MSVWPNVGWKQGFKKGQKGSSIISWIQGFFAFTASPILILLSWNQSLLPSKLARPALPDCWTRAAGIQAAAHEAYLYCPQVVTKETSTNFSRLNCIWLTYTIYYPQKSWMKGIYGNWCPDIEWLFEWVYRAHWSLVIGLPSPLFSEPDHLSRLTKQSQLFRLPKASSFWYPYIQVKAGLHNGQVASLS